MQFNQIQTSERDTKPRPLLRHTTLLERVEPQERKLIMTAIVGVYRELMRMRMLVAEKVNVCAALAVRCWSRENTDTV